MKKIYSLLFLLAALTTVKLYAQTAFGKGNLVIYNVGNGTDTLSSGTYPVNIDEYTTTGTFVAHHPLPTTISGSNKRIVASGTATSEGFLTQSVDSQYLAVPGYDTVVAPAQLGFVTNSTAANTNRVVGIINAAGSIDATTALTDAFSGNNFRSAVTTNGTDIWVGGTGATSGSAGVRYTTKGATTSTKISTTVTNIRQVNIFNGQLYNTASSSQNGGTYGICGDGTGEPKTTGTAIAILPGFPTVTGNGTSAYSFSINADSTIAYVADGSATTSGGGVQKWTRTGHTWSLISTFNGGLTAGVRGLVVDWSKSFPVIYATTADAAPNYLVSITDNGTPANFTTLANSLSKYYIFKGVAFAPHALSTTPVTLNKFIASAISKTAVELKWNTSQEINLSKFDVEKSDDGSSFTSLGTVAANGSYAGAGTYNFTDYTAHTGSNYYRLKMIDADGKYTYSMIQNVDLSGSFTVYPNPASYSITIEHPLNAKGVITITDVLGRVVNELNTSMGNSITTVNIAALTKGQYFVKYTDGTLTNVRSFVKE